MARHIHVVGAVIIQDGLVLCAQRGPEANLPGLWEFPGGKLELDESPREALRREIDEELQCEVEVGAEVETTEHEYEFGIVTLTTFYCTITAGTPTLTEHTNIKWLAPQDLNLIDWAPADMPAVEKVGAELAK